MLALQEDDKSILPMCINKVNIRRYPFSHFGSHYADSPALIGRDIGLGCSFNAASRFLKMT
jgi:hypothetical protein